jgi:hypothetical protein
MFLDRRIPVARCAEFVDVFPYLKVYPLTDAPDFNRNSSFRYFAGYPNHGDGRSIRAVCRLASAIVIGTDRGSATAANLFQLDGDGIPNPIGCAGLNWIDHWDGERDGNGFPIVTGASVVSTEEIDIVSLIEFHGSLLASLNITGRTATGATRTIRAMTFYPSSDRYLFSRPIIAVTQESQAAVDRNTIFRATQHSTRTFMGENGRQMLACGTFSEVAFPYYERSMTPVIDDRLQVAAVPSYVLDFFSLKPIYETTPPGEPIDYGWSSAANPVAYAISDRRNVAIGGGYSNASFGLTPVLSFSVVRSKSIRFSDQTRYASIRALVREDFRDLDDNPVSDELWASMVHPKGTTPTEGSETELWSLEVDGQSYGPFQPHEYWQEFRLVNGEIAGSARQYGVTIQDVIDSGFPFAIHATPTAEVDPTIYDDPDSYTNPILSIERFVRQYDDYPPATWISTATNGHSGIAGHTPPFGGWEGTLHWHGAASRVVSIATSISTGRVTRYAPATVEAVIEWGARLAYNSQATAGNPYLLYDLFEAWGTWTAREASPSVEVYQSGDVNEFFVINQRGQVAKIVRDGSFARCEFVGLDMGWPQASWINQTAGQNPGTTFARDRVVISDGVIRLHSNVYRPALWGVRLLGFPTGEQHEFTIRLKFGDELAEPLTAIIGLNAWREQLLATLNATQAMRGSLFIATNSSSGGQPAYFEDDATQFSGGAPIAVPSAGFNAVYFSNVRTNAATDFYRQRVAMGAIPAPELESFSSIPGTSAEIILLYPGSEHAQTVIMSQADGSIIDVVSGIDLGWTGGASTIDQRSRTAVGSWSPCGNDVITENFHVAY